MPEYRKKGPESEILMKTWILITDLINNKVLFEGPGESESAPTGGIRLIFSSEIEEGRWMLGRKGALLDNRAQLHTRALIRPNITSRMEVFSEYGEMEIPLDHVCYTLEKNQAEIAYTLEGQRFSFRAQYETGLNEDEQERSDEHGGN